MSASSTTAYGFACGGGCEEDVVSEVSRAKKILASSNPPCPPQIHVHVFHRRDPEVLIRRWASCLDHGVAVPRNRPEETRFRERKRISRETWCIAKYASARRMWRLTISAGSPAVSSAAAVRVEFSEGHRQCSDRHSRSRSPPCATTYPRTHAPTRSLGYHLVLRCAVLDDLSFSQDVTFQKDSAGESTVVGQFVNESGVARGIGRYVWLIR